MQANKETAHSNGKVAVIRFEVEIKLKPESAPKKHQCRAPETGRARWVTQANPTRRVSQLHGICLKSALLNGFA